MIVNIPFNKKQGLLNKAQQKQILDYLGVSAKVFLQNRINEVYSINS
jgi:hypothetical protein